MCHYINSTFPNRQHERKARYEENSFTTITPYNIKFSNLLQISTVYTKIEKVAINDALPLKAGRHDVIAKLKSSWGFESELQTNPMPFHLDSPWVPR